MWEVRAQALRSAPYYAALHPALAPAGYLSDPSTHTMRLRARLRANRYHRIAGSADGLPVPACCRRCGVAVPETVRHVLLACRGFAAGRRRFYAGVRAAVSRSTWDVVRAPRPRAEAVLLWLSLLLAGDTTRWLPPRFAPVPAKSERARRRRVTAGNRVAAAAGQFLRHVDARCRAMDKEGALGSDAAALSVASSDGGSSTP